MNSNQDSSKRSNDLRIGACVYLLHGLLQRLEQQQPGLIASLADGVASDRAAMNPAASVEAAHGCEIADEVLSMLRLMSDQFGFKLPPSAQA